MHPMPTDTSVIGGFCEPRLVVSFSRKKKYEPGVGTHVQIDDCAVVPLCSHILAAVGGVLALKRFSDFSFFSDRERGHQYLQVADRTMSVGCITSYRYSGCCADSAHECVTPKTGLSLHCCSATLWTRDNRFVWTRCYHEYRLNATWIHYATLAGSAV
ncbi:hypothetical protein EJ05DRAFT_270382 [Pseudovirgaria hyperparasitica]|uniref:Uncharacterized protein n=1 Tax=Pseudovirgaria hyperparasitica TaxID=470096 RepID=A0A6A6VTT8_9PEZI|nr:uncharacterized protein EJ05DRAFT_270382 [Pseudovirgaria hyperparasitica]KAF2752657.1 hypothetical protein EJ05DRAFT_270382 [Pseudovirgaria hyperparasitica]